MTSAKSPDTKKDYHLHSVKNAFRILKSFSEEESEKTVKELAEYLGISKSAVSRLMATMAGEGFIKKIPGTHRFRLGTSALSLSGVITSSLEIHQETVPILEQLVEKTGETAHLSVLENFHTVYLHKVDSNHPVQTLSYIGKSNPLHCTSSGKVLTAYMDRAFIERLILKGLKKYTAYSITDPEKLISHLEDIKNQEYAIDIEEFLNGVTSIAAPVRDYTKKVIAAVNIVGPIQRIKNENIHLLVKQVVNSAQIISKRMGYMG